MRRGGHIYLKISPAGANFICFDLFSVYYAQIVFEKGKNFLPPPVYNVKIEVKK